MFTESTLKAVSVLGIPSVLTIYLVWWLVSSMTGAITAIGTELKAHQIDTTYIIKANQDFKEQLYFNNLLLQQICTNTAQNSSALTGCFGKIEK